MTDVRGFSELFEFSRHSKRRVSGEDGGHAHSLSLLSLRLKPAEQTLDVLDELGEHGFTQENIDPGIQNGIGGGESDRQQIWVSIQPFLHWRLIKLVEKHLDLETRVTLNFQYAFDKHIIKTFCM